MLFLSVVRVFNPKARYAILYIFGFGVPLFLVFSFTAASIFRGQHPYLRFYEDMIYPLCWLNEEYIWMFLVYVGLVIATNVTVTIRVVAVAYNSAKFR